MSQQEPGPEKTDRETAEPLRFGLVGTGHWARFAYARALSRVPGLTFATVWGRNATAAADLASDFGVGAEADFDRFLAGVDAVAFSVPPQVQSELATRAALAGKHLLLEKPVALTVEAADALAAAVASTGVASVVFFTALFQAESRAWLDDLVRTGGWRGADAVWLGCAHSESSPFNTPWRREKGGLWDLGPHVLSLLWPVFGPVAGIVADRGAGDLTHLILHHENGTSTTATITLDAPDAADGFEVHVWGERGRTSLPSLADDPVAALRTALSELVANARSGQVEHPCDVRFGAEVTRVLARAQDLLDVRPR